MFLPTDVRLIIETWLIQKPVPAEWTIEKDFIFVHDIFNSYVLK